MGSSTFLQARFSELCKARQSLWIPPEDQALSFTRSLVSRPKSVVPSENIERRLYMNADELLDFLRDTSHLVLLGPASEATILSLQKEFLRWQSLLAREEDRRIRVSNTLGE